MITQIVAPPTRIDDATVQSAPTVSLDQTTCPVRTEDRVCPDPIWRSNPAAPVTRPLESRSGCLERLSRPSPTLVRSVSGDTVRPRLASRPPLPSGGPWVKDADRVARVRGR